ncbi:LysR substrate-binding domain-containing protein [Bermanella sp. R86510]|uniref:LysR family transcriptional regulator n=1 Tax=unclassified Bermanella TaxID=2627862 RepID=UPI0037C589D6
MDKLKALQYFAAVAKTGSFTDAGQWYDVPASSVSRRIADLERDLGITLLKRTTRLVQLTEVGREYLEQVNDILQRLDRSEVYVRQYQSEPQGRLVISSMVGFGERILLPLLDTFSERYPKIVLDVRLSDEVSQLNRDQVDIAIRGGYAPNERVVAKKLMANQFIPVAAPSYLEQYGVPSHHQDLKQHKGLFFQTPVGPTPWLYGHRDEWHDVSPKPVLISNNGKWLMQKAMEGKGLLMMPSWVVKESIDQGSLVPLKFDPPLQITDNPGLGVYLLYETAMYPIPKIKAAVDFILARVNDV